MSLPQGAKEGYGSVSPEQAALQRRMDVEQQAFGIAMGATVRYEDFVPPVQAGVAVDPYTEVPFADRVATVNIGPMVSVAPQPGPESGNPAA